MIGFADFLLDDLCEDAVPVNAVGSAVAGTGADRNPPGPRRRRKNRLAQVYGAAVRLAQYRLDQQDNIPPRKPKNGWARILSNAKRSSPAVNEMINRQRTLGQLLERKMPCGAIGRCHQCRDGVCLLSLPIMGGMQ